MMENRTIKNTVLNSDDGVTAGLTVAMMANTIDAAPRRPDHDTSSFCRSGHLNGDMTANTAAGRATNVRNSAISSPCSATSGSCEG